MIRKRGTRFLAQVRKKAHRTLTVLVEVNGIC
jgi:hypothetical protein